MIKAPKKLIEVALPLKAINEAASYEKKPGIGAHPRGLHLWWARRPLTAARAVLFAQLVNDPGGQRGWDSRKGITKEKAQAERQRLFDILKDLVKWENTDNEAVLAAARREIERSWRETCEMNRGEPGFDPDKLPAFHDPFAGGGAIPLEAQRLGLEAWASDLNPVAVAINKAMIEIPPRFAGRAPIGPEPEGSRSRANATEDSRQQTLGLSEDAQERVPPHDWPGATGLAEDVRRYGAWMREEAKNRIGHLYPTVRITKEMVKKRPDLKDYVNRDLTVIAWLWARTVKSPHPAFSDCEVPLISSFVLSTKEGKEVWLEPVIDGRNWRFVVHTGTPSKDAENGTKLGNGANFKCILSGAQMDSDYLRAEGCAKRMGQRLFAVVLDGGRGRVFIEPQSGMDELAKSAKPTWKPTAKLPNDPRNFWTPNYGLTTYGDLFTNRQLVALNTFLDLVQEARGKVLTDAKAAFWSDDGVRLTDGGSGPTAYADAVATYLMFTINRCVDFNSQLNRWSASNQKTMNTFARQSLPMTWDFGETNILNDGVGGFFTCADYISNCILKLPATSFGTVAQADAQTQSLSQNKIISTDPPYYDNIAYADLSDFFYVWMRRGLRRISPGLFSSIETPKEEELVASPYRHDGPKQAEAFFMDGMTATMKNLAERAHPAFPVTIYYAYKQSKANEKGTGNAGWESFLEAVIRAGFQITGTWPMRTEQETRMIGMGTNALASSVVLVCRKRQEDAKVGDRREFLKRLRERMPEALEEMEGGEGRAAQVSPVDRPQAVIGPGMEVFSSFAEVLNADGTRMSVGDAIVEINRWLDPDGGFDPETQFCRDWFRARGWGEGPSGDAITMAQGQGLAVNAVVDAGVLRSRGGKTALIHWRDYPEDYDPTNDRHRPAWEVCHHLVRIHQKRGSGAAGAFLALVQEQGEAARRLAYQLHTLCERKGLAEDARPYNELVAAWDDIAAAAAKAIAAAPKKPKQEQLELGI